MFLILDCDAATELSLEVWSGLVELYLSNWLAQLKLVAEAEFVGLEGCFGLAGVAKDLSTCLDCSHTVSVDLAAPIQHLGSFINRVDVLHAFPFWHMWLHHRKKCEHKLLLAFKAGAERNHASSREDILTDPHADRPSLHEDHSYCWPEKSINGGECHETFEDFEELLVGVAQLAWVELSEEVAAESGRLQQEPSLAVVYDFDVGYICCSNMPPRCIGLSESFRRVEEGLLEKELFEVDREKRRAV
jgi:hypothetical protein